MSLTVERVKQLAAAHAPILRMHHDDIYMPCSAEFFMQNAVLHLAPSPDACKVLS